MIGWIIDLGGMLVCYAALDPFFPEERLSWEDLGTMFVLMLIWPCTLLALIWLASEREDD